MDQLKPPSFAALNVDSAYFGEDYKGNELHVERDIPFQYGSSGILLAFTDREGAVHIARHSPGKMQELKDLGYRNSGIGVPYGNGLPPKMGERAPETFKQVTDFLYRNSLPDKAPKNLNQLKTDHVGLLDVSQETTQKSRIFNPKPSGM